ncbi:hypothetical protein Glove_396g102 [Diversispora epigaea]|uniref:Uncharacterized protein n=1 Tax=Diversispora epigaea TaxID=1348612 RepID=A0A397H5C2_9GLOM|nr:hypothetical protein Glove_396g102 [Diversispora epigaea]
MDEFKNFTTKISESYGLPFGTLGLIIWIFSFYSNFLLYCNIPPISVWHWGKPYKSQSLFPAFFAFAFIAGPTICTCYFCRQEWILVILALGQLSPWAFKIYTDSFAAIHDNGIRENPPVPKREDFYRKCGGSLSILTGLCGWVGFSALIHKLRNMEHEVNSSIYILYSPLFFMLILIFVKPDDVDPKILSLFKCLATIAHLIGSNIILAEITEIDLGIGNGTGAGSGIASFWLIIVYTLGICLSFVNF